MNGRRDESFFVKGLIRWHFKIVEGCVNCWACESLCPSEAIFAATPHFLIDAKKCTECEGAFADPQCASICPVEGVILDGLGVPVNPPGSLTGIPPGAHGRRDGGDPSPLNGHRPGAASRQPMARTGCVFSLFLNPRENGRVTSTVIFYEKPGCLSNHKQKSLLRSLGHDLSVRNLLAEPWTPDHLRSFFGDLPVRDWFNPTAPRVKQGEVQPAMLDEATALALMIADPLLIRRPLLDTEFGRGCGFASGPLARRARRGSDTGSGSSVLFPDRSGSPLRAARRTGRRLMTALAPDARHDAAGQHEAVEIAPGVHWIGALDPTLRSFDIILRTANGTTYNAYLVRGRDGVAVIDTVKAGFADDFFARLEAVARYDEIRVIVLNHLEPDHTGALPELMRRAPQAKLYISTRATSMLKALLKPKEDERPFDYQTVGTGDEVSLGDRTLRFLHTPFLHWPDTQCTYLVEDGVLFSGDVFGCHHCDSRLFNDRCGDFRFAFDYYYAHIMRPFKTHVVKALKLIEPLALKIIAPTHGPILRDRPRRYLTRYRELSTRQPDGSDRQR